MITDAGQLGGFQLVAHVESIAEYGCRAAKVYVSELPAFGEGVGLDLAP